MPLRVTTKTQTVLSSFQWPISDFSSRPSSSHSLWVCRAIDLLSGIQSCNTRLGLRWWPLSYFLSSIALPPALLLVLLQPDGQKPLPQTRPPYPQNLASWCRHRVSLTISYGFIQDFFPVHFYTLCLWRTSELLSKRYPKATHLGETWIAHLWYPSCTTLQYLHTYPQFCYSLNDKDSLQPFKFPSVCADLALP